ncbi:hypothetical protein MMC10_003272 [Thelotrema lepadinum]|nr:hypothetical protein [Thelotrema lepadinum]
MVIIGQIFSDGVVGALFAAIKLGLGLHEYRVLAEDPSPPLVLARIEEIIWAYAVMNNVCLFAIKMSILLFYHRLFHVQHWFRTAWWINVVSAILWLVGSTLFYIFQCTPIDFFWTHLGAVTPNPSLYVDPQGYCTSGAAKIGAPILVNNLSDVAVLLLPIPVVFGLKTTWTKRVRLILLFSIGALAAASGFARLATLFTSDGDATYSTVGFLIWSQVEDTLGIFCANVPLIVALFETRAKSARVYTATTNNIGFDKSPSTLLGNAGAESTTIGGGGAYGKGKKYKPLLDPNDASQYALEDRSVGRRAEQAWHRDLDPVPRPPAPGSGQITVRTDIEWRHNLAEL